MSSLSSPEQAAAFSEAICLDGGQFAQLNVMPTPHPFWRRGKMMDASNPSPSGQTSQVLTADHGEELLTSFLRVSHARISAAPERVAASKAKNQAFTTKSLESFAILNQEKSGWKIAQCSLLGDSEPFSAIWPRSGTMRAGVCSALPTLDSNTFASASGYALPTPSGVNGGRNNMMGRIDEWGGSTNPLRGTVIGSMCLPAFEELVMGWPIGWTEPTPYAMDKFHAWQQQHGGF